MRFLLIAIVMMGTAQGALANHHEKHKKLHAVKKASKDTVQVIFSNILEDGKKVWLPKSITLVPGEYEFVLRNHLSEPHGFEIKGMTKMPIVVPKNGTKLVRVNAKKGNYDIKCHMHPAHVGAKLVVQ